MLSDQYALTSNDGQHIMAGTSAEVRNRVGTFLSFHLGFEICLSGELCQETGDFFLTVPRQELTEEQAALLESHHIEINGNEEYNHTHICDYLDMNVQPI